MFCARVGRRYLCHFAVAVAAFGAVGLFGAAGTAGATPDGSVVTDTCTGVSGSLNYRPGLLRTTTRKVLTLETSITTGCSDSFSGPLPGTGTFAAALSGNVSLSSENFTGLFTIYWPQSSGFNPSNGTLTITESGGLENVTGTVTSGFDTGSALSLQYVTTGKTGKGTRRHPVTAQAFTNTTPLTLSHNNS